MYFCTICQKWHFLKTSVDFCVELLTETSIKKHEQILPSKHKATVKSQREKAKNIRISNYFNCTLLFTARF